MRLLTYQMPPEITHIASGGELDEFDLNEFFAANGTGVLAQFKHKDEVQKWLNVIRNSPDAPRSFDSIKSGLCRRGPIGHAVVAPLAAQFLVPTQCRSLPRNGEPAGREAQYILARL